MSNEIVTTSNDIIESVIIQGDLSKLTPPQRVNYYQATCKSLGLNPLTKPFDYITLNGRLTLYAKRDAADQLRKINGVSITKLERETMNGVYIVTAYAQDKTGRTDSSIGAVNIENLKGDALANAMMKAETKSKRRVTLSICGLGMLDETEVETIPDANIIPADDLPEPAPVVFDDNLPEISYESACEITTSKGLKYGEVDSRTLSFMSGSIRKSLAKNHMTPEDKELHHLKLSAIQTILDERSK